MSNNCDILTCTDAYYAKGFCSKHYQRYLKHGDPEIVLEGRTNKLPEGVAAKNKVYANYRYSAERRGLEFRLTLEDAENYFQSECGYCGSPPDKTTSFEGLNGQYLYNGIDRIDNNEGYKLGNCLSCCYVCNLMKRDMSYDAFLRQTVKIAERLRLGVK